jgi:DNA-binding transcriptional LysR family regulator
VETDQVDLGLVSYPKPSRIVKAIEWRDEPMVLVCARTHRLAWRDEVSLDELDGCEWVSFDPQLQIRREIDRVLAAQDIEMRVVMEFDNIETIKRAIEIDAGVALLPAPTVDREVQAGTLVARKLKGIQLTRPVGIIVRSNKELSATARLFIQLLRQQGQQGHESGCDQGVQPASSHSAGVNGMQAVHHRRRRKRPAGA